MLGGVGKKRLKCSGNIVVLFKRQAYIYTISWTILNFV